jgi:hypothetical protein
VKGGREGGREEHNNNNIPILEIELLSGTLLTSKLPNIYPPARAANAPPNEVSCTSRVRARRGMAGPSRPISPPIDK